VAALAEFLGGICLVVGLFTRYAALAIAIIMTIAITTAHYQRLVGGYEFPLLLLAAAVALMLTGGGPLSFDKSVLRRDF
jgi:putative oxidoreductase